MGSWHELHARWDRVPRARVRVVEKAIREAFDGETLESCAIFRDGLDGCTDRWLTVEEVTALLFCCLAPIVQLRSCAAVRNVCGDSTCLCARDATYSCINGPVHPWDPGAVLGRAAMKAEIRRWKAATVRGGQE